VVFLGVLMGSTKVSYATNPRFGVGPVLSTCSE
jgi:hypothetical protein